jgi:hypothetical protein
MDDGDGRDDQVGQEQRRLRRLTATC